MTLDAAQAFLDRLESDPVLVDQIESLRHDPVAALAAVRAAGFDVTADEVRDAFGERFGEFLGANELEAIAGGHLNDGVVVSLFLAGHSVQPAAFAAAAAV